MKWSRNTMQLAVILPTVALLLVILPRTPMGMKFAEQQRSRGDDEGGRQLAGSSYSAYSASYSAYSSSYSAYSSSYSAYSAYDSYGYGDGGHHYTVFELGDELPRNDKLKRYVVISFGAMIGFTIFMEGFLEVLEEHSTKFFNEILSKIYKELAILGLISFILFSLITSGTVEHSDQLTAFEFTHLVVFFLGGTFIFQGVVAAAITTRIGHAWQVAGQLPQEYFLTKARELGSGLRFEFSTLRTQMEYHIFRAIFLKLYKLPAAFDYATYARDILDEHILHEVGRDLSSWFVLFGFIVIDAYAFGFFCFGSLGSFVVAGWVLSALELVVAGSCQLAINNVLRKQGCKNYHHISQMLSTIWPHDDEQTLSELKSKINTQASLHTKTGAAHHDHKAAHGGAKIHPGEDGEALRQQQKVVFHAVGKQDQDNDNDEEEKNSEATPKAGNSRSTHRSAQWQAAEVGARHELVGISLSEVFPLGSDKFWELAIDAMRMLVAFYLAVIMAAGATRALAHDQPFMIFVMMVPPVLSTFVIGPAVERRYALLLSISICDLDLVGEVVERMEEQAEITQLMAIKLLGEVKESQDWAAAPALIEGMFNTFDADGSGHIDYDEFRHGLVSIGLNLSKRMFAAMCRLIDPDDSKHIDRNEWCSLLEAQVELLKQEVEESIVHAHARPEDQVLALEAEVVDLRHEIQFLRTKALENHHVSDPMSLISEHRSSFVSNIGSEVSHMARNILGGGAGGNRTMATE